MSNSFYSHYNMDWIAFMEIGLDLNNSVYKEVEVYMYSQTHQNSMLVLSLNNRGTEM